MKVLMVIPEFYGFKGASTNERQLAIYLSKIVERAFVFSMDSFTSLRRRCKWRFYNQLENDKLIVFSLIIFDIHPIFINISVIFYSFMFALLALLLKILKLVDVVYIRGSLAAFPFCTLASIFNLKPVALKFAAFATDDINPRLKPILKRFAILFHNAIDYYTVRKSNLIVVHSDEMKEYIKYRCNVDKLFVVVPPGVDFNKIVKISKFAPRERKNHIFKVGFLGNVSWKKGIDLLVKALSEVQKSHPNVMLCIIGGGRELPKIKLMAQKLSVKLFATGFVPHDVALSLLKKMDVLVIPRRRSRSTRTNLPIDMLEAFALGVPVIITKDEVMAKMFREYEEILFIEPDPSDVAEKILLLISNEKLRRKLQRNSVIAAKKFNYRKIAENLCYNLLKGLYAIKK